MSKVVGIDADGMVKVSIPIYASQARFIPGMNAGAFVSKRG